jgi:short-subunit dehydrogenase
MSVFAGKRIVITGGSSGIGKQLAVDLLTLGAHVTIVADRPERLAQARDELAAIAPSVATLTCDIGDVAQIRATAAAYIAQFGAPHVLINNAGYAVYRTFAEMDSEEISRLFNVNLTGACVMTREFLPAMIAAGEGHIVLVASIAGAVPMTPCGPYSAAKHGMVAFGEILRAELDRFKLRVHVVCPGRVETEFFAHETFVQRAPRRETEWTIPIERVSGAILEAIRRDRFLTYVPRIYGPLAWLVRALPFVFRPMLRRLMRARVETVYAGKS